MDSDLERDLFELSVLSGIPLTILAIMTRVGSALTQSTISRRVRCDPKTARVHLGFLESGGYVQRLEDGRWALLRHDVPLPKLGYVSAALPAETQEAADDQGESPPVLRTTVEKSFVDRKNGRQVGTVDEESGDGRLTEELIAAFKAASILRFKWKKLAAKAHVTPEYVRAMHERVKNHPDPEKRTTAFLVHCIECGDPLPELCPNCNETLPAHRTDCYLRYRSESDAGLAEY